MIETGLPAFGTLPAGETFHASDASPEHYCIDEYDVANQGLISHHFWPSEGRTLSMPFRYVWPSELDLLARIAAMRPRERWSGWRREQFTSESGKLVGVCEKPG